MRKVSKKSLRGALTHEIYILMVLIKGKVGFVNQTILFLLVKSRIPKNISNLFSDKLL